MTVFGWILFIVTALIFLGSLYTWFAEGKGLATLFASAALVVYQIFYLFLTPFGSTVTWIYFAFACGLALVGLLQRQPFALLGYGVYIVFFALILFA